MNYRRMSVRTVRLPAFGAHTHDGTIAEVGVAPVAHGSKKTRDPQV
jgi:hypothetical protein